MAGQQGRHDPKEAALAAARCLNPHPEQVTDPEFLASDFFDARDAVQVKYEMVRKVQAGGAPVTEAAAAFGYSRPAYYAAAAALESSGLEGLVARPARAARRQQAHRGDPRLGRGAAGRRTPRCARRSCRTGSSRPSACACTPARPSERWPAAGSATPKAAELPAREMRKEETRPCPCDRHLATRLLNQAPAWMPARTVPPAAGWTPATSSFAMLPCTRAPRRSRSGSACWPARASLPGGMPWPA